MILAHFGHWYIQLIYGAPVIIIVTALSIQTWRANRSGERNSDPGEDEF